MPFTTAVTIRSDTRYLAFLRSWVAAVAMLFGLKKFPPRSQQAVTLALIEAVDNAIFHAHHRQAHMPIRIRLRMNATSIVLEVEDNGGGIGRRALGVPQPLSTHGRGLFMIEKLMHRVTSVKRKKKHLLHMTLFLSGAQKRS